MGRYRVLYNNIAMPGFCKVVEVRNSILPSISQNTLTIPGRIGAYSYGNEIGTRVIEIDIIIFSDRPNNLPMYSTQVAQWLLYNEPQKLILEDNITRYYMASFTGDSTLEELATIGKTTLTFVCYDPLQYGAETTIPINLSGMTKVTNVGTAPSFPIIRFKVNKNLTGLTVVGRDDFIDIGNPMTVDTTVEDYEPYAIKDYLESYNGWTQSSGVLGGKIDVPISEWEVWDNSSFRIPISNFKSAGNEWHGGCIQKQATNEVQDFEFIAPIHFNGKDNRSRAQLQTNVLDNTGSSLVQVTYKDGSLNGSECIVTVDLRNGGTKQNVLNYKIPAKYLDFVGSVYITRKSNKWTIKLGRKNSSSLLWSTGKGIQFLTTKSYVDSGKKFMQKAKYVQFACMIYATLKDEEGTKNDLSRNYMAFYNVYLKDLKPYNPSEDKLPIIIYSGDEITIDCNTGEVYKNDEYFMDFINPTSPFIKLDNLHNGINILPEGCVSNGEIVVKASWY